MVGTKSRGYLTSGWLSEGEYSIPFFRPIPALQKPIHWILLIFLHKLESNRSLDLIRDGLDQDTKKKKKHPEFPEMLKVCGLPMFSSFY